MGKKIKIKSFYIRKKLTRDSWNGAPKIKEMKIYI